MRPRASGILNVLAVLSALAVCYLIAVWLRMYLMVRAERAAVVARHGPGARVPDASAFSVMPPSFWILSLACSVLPIFWLARRLRSRRSLPGRCSQCGYDLRATPDQCPECGAMSAD
jgi:hypothetical protein